MTNSIEIKFPSENDSVETIKGFYAGTAEISDIESKKV